MLICLRQLITWITRFLKTVFLTISLFIPLPLGRLFRPGSRQRRVTWSRRGQQELYHPPPPYGCSRVGVWQERGADRWSTRLSFQTSGFQWWRGWRRVSSHCSTLTTAGKFSSSSGSSPAGPPQSAPTMDCFTKVGPPDPVCARTSQPH